MKKPSLLCTRLGAALLTVCLLLGLLPIASAASAAPRPPVAADGRILYVAPNGSDANPGSYAEPFATLEAAMNAMNPGDLLYVRGGLYRSAGTGRGISQKKGTVDKWFTVLNYPGETPVFDGEWYGDATIGMLFDSCAYWHIEGLEFRNYTQDAVYLRNGCDHFEIVNMKLHDVTSLVHGASAYDGIVVIGSTNVLIEGCEIWNIGYARDLGSMLDHGVYVSTGSSNVTVRGCYFHEIPSGSGVQFNHEPVHDGLVENNLFVNTALGTVLSQCYNVTVKNNTYYHNKMSDVYVTERAHDNTVAYNLFGPMQPHETTIASYHIYFPLLNCLYNSFDHNFYDNSATSNSVYPAVIENWGASGCSYAQKVDWSVWQNDAETDAKYGDGYFEDKYDGNTTETISGLGFDKNGQTGAVKYVNPDKGNFALASGSDCTIAGAGMQNPTWSPVEAAADDPVYLFPNYSFEENYSEFWTRHLEWGNNTTHALDDSQSYAGAKSLHLSSDGSNGRYFFSTDYRVSIKPNTEYTISIKVKAADGTAETAKTYFALGECNSSWQEYHKDTQFGNTITGSTNGWQVLTATFTSQADATLLCVDLVTEGKGEWYYDDINLSETRTVPQAADEIFRSMLANPGFEKDFAGTWTRAHYYPSGVESSCSIERDNTVAYSGTYSMHYHVGTAAVTEVSLGTDFRTAVKPNTSYKITLQAKTSAETSAEAKIWLNLGECFATPTWGDIYNDVQKGNILTGPQADWTAISATIYTAANAEYINVQPAVSGTGDFWFDHIIVVEIPGEANALDTAKNAALDSLDAAVAALDQNAYTYWNWALVQTAKMNGINAVKQASDAASADAAAAAAVSAIQAVKPISATKTEMSAQIAAAKKTVSDAADPDDYREAQKMEVQKLQSAFAQLVDTFDTEQSIEKLTKKCCDLLAAIKTDEQITAEELAAAKAAAKDALDKYAVRSDYTLENWNLVKAEKKKGNAAIDAATSVAAVDKALAAAKAAIDQIESISGAAERLAKAKQDAIEELRAYMQSKDFPADKQSEAERILNDGIAEINAAETLDDVADALATAKEALRKLASGGEPSEEERLAEAKQNAEEALKDYADGKTFTGANTRPAVDAIIKATKAINAASAVDEVNAALAEAKAALDRLASDAPIDKPDHPIIVVPVTRPSENNTFKDVSSSDWFYDEVQYVYQKNLMNGTGTSSFSPRDTLTRAMLVTILYRIEGEPSVSYSGKFSDVPSGRWYSKAVEWAAAQGIVGGYSNGKFGPEDSVTREQLAAILYRYAGKTKGFDVSASASLSGYTDSAKVSAYAQSAVKWAIATNLLLPTSGKLNAGADATRAEVAVAVARFHQQFVK